MKTPHLKALRTLETVLRTGNFATAAKELNVTTAAVGQQIRSLEVHLNRALFDRRPTGAVPTAAAEAAGNRLTAAFEEISDLLEQLDARPDPARIAITMTRDIAEVWLPRELPDFLATVGEVDLRLDSRRDLVDWRKGEFDFAIRVMKNPPENLASVQLFKDRFAPVCTHDFARRYNLGPHTKTLEKVPIATWQLEADGRSWIEWESFSARFGVALGKNLGSQSIVTSGTTPGLAKGGLALVMSGIDGLELLMNGELILPFGPDSYLESGYSYYLLWSNERNLSTKQRAFRDWVTTRAESQGQRFDAWLDGMRT